MDPLVEAAVAARANAYAPYSVYSVGAALVGADGQIYTGCNVENVSFGLTICAERTALVKMVSAGCREVRRIAIVTADGGTPCGACRQFLTEFSPDPKKVEIVCVSESGETSYFTLGELLPHSFSTQI